MQQQQQQQHVPRVNGRMIPSFDGQRVCLVGRVLQSTQRETILEASDRQQVRIVGGVGGLFPQQSIWEVIGFAQKDGSIMESSRTEYAESFNFENYEEMLKLTQRSDLKSLFS